ncbi:MAG: AsmA family protein [Oceanospirillaceae bacterium]|nr:AsmA family protein [Oceanospirillaceae bacterium]
MKKIFKILAITIAAVLLLAVTGATLLGLLLDPNDFKTDIQQAALDNANIELQINGDINWSIYPSIGLEINSITAGYPNKATLAALESAQVSVMLIPLLSGDVQMKAINIQGLVLNLVKDKDHNNWQQTSASDTVSSTEKDTSTTLKTEPKVTTSSPAENAISIKNIDIESINITDATINYADNVAGQHTSIKNFNLTTERITSNKPFKAELSFDLSAEQANKQPIKASIALAGNFDINLEQLLFRIEDLSSKVTVITDRELSLALNADLDLNLKTNRISVDNLRITSAALKATGKLQLSGDQYSNIKGNIAIQPFDLKALMAEFKLPAIVTGDPDSLRAISLSTDIIGSATQLQFSKLLVTIDNTNIQGDASYQLASGLIGFNLQGDSINLNNYLPAAAAPAKNASSGTPTTAQKTTQTKATTTATGYSKEIIIPMQPLRDLSLKGQLTFKKIQYQKTNITSLALNLDANKGLVKITKLNMNAYAGAITSQITLDARQQPLQLKINNTVKNLQIGPVLHDFAQSEMMTGTLGINSQLTLSGQSIYSLVNSLSGNIDLSLAEGVIQGINAAQEMCETINKVASLGGLASSTQAVDKSTPFASITGTFKLKNGVVSNQNFNADLDAINASGKGSVNLAKQTLNYRLGLKIQDNLFNKSCSVNNKIQGIVWPIDCKGKFSDDPLTLCKPDLSVVKDIVKKAIQDKLQKKLEKELGGSIKEQQQELQQKVEEKVKDKLKGLLKGLF